VHAFCFDNVDTTFAVAAGAAGLRVDSGFEDNTAVSVHYDAMLAKVITWAPTRDQAALALAKAIERATIHGVTTNRDLLVRVLRHRASLDGAPDPAFSDRHGLATLAAPLIGPEEESVAAIAAALAIDAASPQVLAIPRGWRNVPSQSQRIELDGPAG